MNLRYYAAMNIFCLSILSNGGIAAAKQYNDISYSGNESSLIYEICCDSTNRNIESYKINYENGITETIEPTDIPALKVESGGLLIEVYYDNSGNICAIQDREINAGDACEISTLRKKVYLYTEGDIEKIIDSDTTVKGFAINSEEKYEIDPVYRFDNLDDISSSTELDANIAFPAGYYDITFKKADTECSNLYVNGLLVGNNVDQAAADRVKRDGALFVAENIKIEDSEIHVSMKGASTKVDYIKVEKKPDFYKRPQRVYVLGDSLVCIYYGESEKLIGAANTGWGQQLSNFINTPITNLAAPGMTASSIYKLTYPTVLANAEKGDIVLIECGVNDKTYGDSEIMQKLMTEMIGDIRNAGAEPIIVTPNASDRLYTADVGYSEYMRKIASETDCKIIDLAKESYNFLYSLYGDRRVSHVNRIYNLNQGSTSDTLHSSYAGAMVWASLVAQGLKDLGYDNIVNTDFEYTFTDAVGNQITARVE